MGLHQVAEPEYLLMVSHKNDKIFDVVKKNNIYLSPSSVIGENFMIAQGHFGDHVEKNFLSNDLTWGYARNILFTVVGYCDKMPYADESRKYTLVCKIEAIL